MKSQLFLHLQIDQTLTHSLVRVLASKRKLHKSNGFHFEMNKTNHTQFDWNVEKHSTVINFVLIPLDLHFTRLLKQWKKIFSSAFSFLSLCWTFGHTTHYASIFKCKMHKSLNITIATYSPTFRFTPFFRVISIHTLYIFRIPRK